MKSLLYKLKRKTLSEKITYILYFAFFAFFSFVLLYPFYLVFINSLKSAAEYFSNNYLLPQQWYFENYIKVFVDFKYRDSNYLDMFINSLWITSVRIFVTVLSSAFLAYAVSMFRFPGKEFLYALVIFIQTVPIVGTGAAGYKLLSSLGMVNNPALIWMAWASGFDFAFLVFYAAFRGISIYYSESAEIDGASNLQIMFKIVFPQIFPVIAAIAITSSIDVWNDYAMVMIYLRDFPNLAYGLFVFNTESGFVENSQTIFYAAVCVSVLPPVILYAANQNLILKNMTAGGLKG